jgi:hypothetical protein
MYIEMKAVSISGKNNISSKLTIGKSYDVIQARPIGVYTYHLVLHYGVERNIPKSNHTQTEAHRETKLNKILK